MLLLLFPVERPKASVLLLFVFAVFTETQKRKASENHRPNKKSNLEISIFRAWAPHPPWPGVRLALLSIFPSWLMNKDSSSACELAGCPWEGTETQKTQSLRNSKQRKASPGRRLHVFFFGIVLVSSCKHNVPLTNLEYTSP